MRFAVSARLLRRQKFKLCFSQLRYDIFDFVLNFYKEVSASPFTKNVLRMFEAHLWKKIRMLSLNEKITILIKKACNEYKGVEMVW